MYGEPPPSYKMSKYYPKANATTTASAAMTILINKKSSIASTAEEDNENNEIDNEDDEEDKASHIYENIDELQQHHLHFQSKNNSRRDPTATKRRRSRFSALKKVIPSFI